MIPVHVPWLWYGSDMPLWVQWVSFVAAVIGAVGTIVAVAWFRASIRWRQDDLAERRAERAADLARLEELEKRRKAERDYERFTTP